MVFTSSHISGRVLGLELSPNILPDVAETWNFLVALSSQNMALRETLCYEPGCGSPVGKPQLLERMHSWGWLGRRTDALSVHRRANSVPVIFTAPAMLNRREHQGFLNAAINKTVIKLSV